MFGHVYWFSSSASQRRHARSVLLPIRYSDSFRSFGRSGSGNHTCTGAVRQQPSDKWRSAGVLHLTSSLDTESTSYSNGQSVLVPSVTYNITLVPVWKWMEIMSVRMYPFIWRLISYTVNLSTYQILLSIINRSSMHAVNSFYSS